MLSACSARNPASDRVIETFQEPARAAESRHLEVLAKGQAAHPGLAYYMERPARIVAFQCNEAGEGGGDWAQSGGSDR